MARRNRISPGRSAAIRGHGATGTARRQESAYHETVSLEPGYMAERIEKSQNRKRLLEARFGKDMGGRIEKSRNRFNLVRESMTTGAGTNRKK